MQRITLLSPQGTYLGYKEISAAVTELELMQVPCNNLAWSMYDDIAWRIGPPSNNGRLNGRRHTGSCTVCT